MIYFLFLKNLHALQSICPLLLAIPSARPNACTGRSRPIPAWPPGQCVVGDIPDQTGCVPEAWGTCTQRPAAAPPCRPRRCQLGQSTPTASLTPVAIRALGHRKTTSYSLLSGPHPQNSRHVGGGPPATVAWGRKARMDCEAEGLPQTSLDLYGPEWVTLTRTGSSVAPR